MNNAKYNNNALADLLTLITDVCSQNEEREQRASLMANVLGQVSNYKKDERKVILEALAQQVPANELSEAFVRQAASVGAELTSASSFRECLTRATRKRQLSGIRNELELNSKARGYRFVRALGVPHPKRLCQPAAFDELELLDNSVLKPTNGSSSEGLFIFANGKIIEVKSGKLLADKKHLKETINRLLEQGRVKNDRWVLEEYIGDMQTETSIPARDLKFYCFYGKLGFVLEVDRQRGGHYCEWMPDMSKADTGRYRGKTFDGAGFTEQQAAQALAISEQIPAPFMRIDFLASQTQFVFGEFTPRPGQYNAFNTEFDRYLGELYLDAESRLLDDLVYGGRSFRVFNKVVPK